jgi:hypothetical protein
MFFALWVGSLVVISAMVPYSQVHPYLQKSDTLRNLWWCPTGPFTFLPIHAAGMYNDGEPQCVSDYVVSSYTPTISALLSDVPVSDPFKMMVVIEPNTPGQIGLPRTVAKDRKPCAREGFD